MKMPSIKEITYAQKAMQIKEQELTPVAHKVIEEARAKNPQILEYDLVNALMEIQQSKDILKMSIDLAPRQALKEVMGRETSYRMREQFKTFIKQHDKDKTTQA
jgi:hypothetical protein